MARPLRLEYPGAFFHVTNRGNGRQKIFKDNRDREKLLGYLAGAVEKFSIKIHIYCLMPNHYHLVVETPQANLSVAMQWINVSYATYYNKRWRKVGHLFQGRFQAILVDADAYLIEVSRYVHLNPVRAKLVSAPGDYPWSSYRGFIGKAKAAEWVETGVVLGSFGAGKRQAYKRYKSFVEAGDATSVENPAQGIVGGFILGSEQFVDWVKEKFLSAREDNKEIPQLRELKPRVGLKTMVEAVCKEFSCSEEQIRKKGRKSNKARQVAIYLAWDLSGLRCTDLGMYFGAVSGALITMMHNRVATEISENKSMRGRIAKIKSRFLNI